MTDHKDALQLLAWESIDLIKKQHSQLRQALQEHVDACYVDDCEMCHRHRTLLTTTEGKIPHEAIEALVSAAQNAVTNKQSHYKARNGRLVTIEGDDGERMWLVSLEDMNDIERALEAADAAREQGAEVEPVSRVTRQIENGSAN